MRLIRELTVSATLVIAAGSSVSVAVATESTIKVSSGDWVLVGDLAVPESNEPVPVVLMLNKAAGDRTAYKGMARALQERSIASLRLDLRGHGESTNLDTFVPGEKNPHPMIWDAEQAVVAALKFLRNDRRFDPDRIAVVSASYSVGPLGARLERGRLQSPPEWGSSGPEMYVRSR